MKKPPVIKDYMATSLLTLKPTKNIFEAIKFLLDNKISGAPVVDDENQILGLISEKDCLKLMAKGLDNNIPKVNVVDFMTTKVDTILPEMDIYFAAGIFIKNTRGSSTKSLPIREIHQKIAGVQH